MFPNANMLTPAFVYLIMLDTLKIGIIIAEAPRIAVKMNTIIEGRLYLSIICFTILSPIIIAKVVMKPIIAP